MIPQEIIEKFQQFVIYELGDKYGAAIIIFTKEEDTPLQSFHHFTNSEPQETIEAVEAALFTIKRNQEKK